MSAPASTRHGEAPAPWRRVTHVIAALRRAATALSVIVALALFATARALAASPSPNAEGDTRSSGQGPGFVGAPLAAIAGVIAIGLISAILTIGYVRLTAGTEGSANRADRGRTDAGGVRRDR